MIKIKGLNKTYYSKEQNFHALIDVNLEFYDGEFIAILGESGSGKSTLLNMLSGIDNYTEGEIIIDGVNTKNFDDTKWRKFRNKNVGFVFQRYNLVEHLTAKENVTLPLVYAGEKKQEIETKAKKILTEVGLAEHLNTQASKLSGGEKQRVAISRSILTNPHILLCDEPTGALDSASSSIIMKMIKGYATGNSIVIMVTHDEKLAKDYADRIIRIHDGKIIADDYIGDKVPQEKAEETSDKKTLKKMTSNYKKVNRHFSKFLAKANYQQNKASNLKIISSFVIGLTILFVINLILSNVIVHNKAMFERNNDYKKFYISDFNDETLNQLKQNDLISEVGEERRYLIEDSYLQIDETKHESNYIEAANSAHTLILETRPEKYDNFYLKDQVLVMADDITLKNGVFVTSELLYTHYLDRSIEKDNYNDYEKTLKSFFKQYPLKSFLNQSIYICGDSNGDECYESKIVGILDSNYNGINYAGKIFISPEGFDDFLDYLITDLDYKTVNKLYRTKTYLFYKDFTNENSKDLEELYNIQIINTKIEKYQQVLVLEQFANYILFFIIGAIFIIFGTVVINIIQFNIESRTKDIGVYTSIGVSRVTIRRIFIYETIKVLRNLIGLLVLDYAIIVFIFRYLYTIIITYNNNLIEEFGRNDNISYEIYPFIYIIIATIILYLASVYIPAYRVSRKKAIDTLSW